MSRNISLFVSSIYELIRISEKIYRTPLAEVVLSGGICY